MAKTNRVVKVSPYKRQIKGKLYKVKKHKRKHRGLGKRIKYKKVGEFQVAYDELGNFRGSRVIKRKQKPRKGRRRALPSMNIPEIKASTPDQKIRELDRKYFEGKLELPKYLDRRRNLLNKKLSK